MPLAALEDVFGWAGSYLAHVTRLSTDTCISLAIPKYVKLIMVSFMVPVCASQPLVLVSHFVAGFDAALMRLLA